MPTYNLFELFPDGRFHDTNLSITTPADSGDATIKSDVLKLYGFRSDYDAYYRLTRRGNGIYISSTFHEGSRDVWFLAEDKETKETVE